jgi:hypothetical protein
MIHNWLIKQWVTHLKAKSDVHACMLHASIKIIPTWETSAHPLSIINSVHPQAFE